MNEIEKEEKLRLKFLTKRQKGAFKEAVSEFNELNGKFSDRAIQDKTDVLQGKRTTKNELETAAIKNSQKRVTLVQGEREDNGMDESGCGQCILRFIIQTYGEF
ncbi:hypothetical protein RhiirA1_387995 [Rhizophagus irregularis]|uniref:Uncharacterized protein n=1 Tax=Rhizophagus irregularis TaxID=588596 RepID=A0A2N0SG93_9GLOM|nr:hypothetical protein RhiirA1_387995 [Rhizophagus irregularis]